MEKLANRIFDLLGDITDSEMISIHNEYCNQNYYYDDYIERVADIDDLYNGLKPSEIIDIFEDLNPRDTYYVRGTNGVQSFNSYYESPVEDYASIATYCAENDDDLGSNEIRQCIDEWNEEHEDEED